MAKSRYISDFAEIIANKVVPNRVLAAYAAWRVGATPQERRAHLHDPRVLLTFDDYGSREQVERLLAILRRERVQAMFFLQGDWAAQAPELVSLIAEAGHEVGNHTYSHPDLDQLTDEEVKDQINRGPHSRWLRPPRGRYDKRIRAIAKSLGYKICYWTIDSDDWQGVPATHIRKKVLDNIHPGAVVLFHIFPDETYKALPGIIKGIRAQGYNLWAPGELNWKK